MFNTVLYRYLTVRSALSYLRTLSEVSQIPAKTEPIAPQVIDTRDIKEDQAIDEQFVKKSVFDECNVDISHIAPYLKPTFNYAAYANKSETLQHFVKLGVNIHKWEKKPDLMPYILQLNYETDVKNHLLFLSDLGVPADEFSTFLTKNPLIFKEDLDNLRVRINYLKSKKFNNEMITRIVTKNPYWLLFSTQRIDSNLGFFQSHFKLNGNEVRTLTTHQPRIITYSITHIKLNAFTVKEEMGFTDEDMKRILMNKPIIFMKRHENILKTFEFIHTKMKIPLERIVESPGVLTCRLFRIRQRHLFLEKLGKAQYNSCEPNYVSLLALASGTDAEFCSQVAKSSIQAFNTYLKSE